MDMDMDTQQEHEHVIWTIKIHHENVQNMQHGLGHGTQHGVNTEMQHGHGQVT
jgi:hypothetical protein